MSTPGKIFIVDDKPEVRLSLKLILEDAGYTIEEASNGKEAIQVLQENGHDYDLVITDIMMPEVDGVELMTALRIMNSQIPVLAVSGGGYTMDAQEMIGAALQVSDHILKKPFTPDELTEAIQITLDNKKQGAVI